MAVLYRRGFRPNFCLYTRAVASKITFPKLTAWDETRETLHAYARVLGAVRAAFTPEQPRHEHGSLRLYTSGLTTTPIPHPLNTSRNFSLSLDLRNHYVLFSTSEGDVHQWRISEGLSATKLGEQIIAKLAEMDVHGKINQRKFASERPNSYAFDESERYFGILSQVGRLFENFRETLPGEKSPVLVWPKLFDLSFALLGADLDSQIVFGFNPAGAVIDGAYFFVSSTPQQPDQLSQALPAGARWHTDGWQGALLPYAEVADKADAAQRIRGFLQAVYELQKSIL